ncbi:MAG: acetyl-CoA C-acyltransferase, partial [Chloroflexi bacterium]|nr:acetyl-CoA C-acyltransferase [Chloroflexota bacterium]
MEMQNVVIVDGVRSAFTRGGRGAFTATRLDTIGVQVLQELLGRYPQLSPTEIEDVGMGCVGGVAELAGIGAN